MPTVQTAPARRTLEYQIGRLDSILDGLADNLQDAVTTAVQTAVTEVVRATLKEELAAALTNRQVEGFGLHKQPLNRLTTELGESAASNRQLGRVRKSLVRMQHGLVLCLACILQCSAATWAWRWQILLALSVGSAVGGGCYLVGPLLGVILLGLVATGITLVCFSRRASQSMHQPASAGLGVERSEPRPEPSLNGQHYSVNA